MKKKLRVAVLFGGRSAEHEISIISAKNVVQAIDRSKYEVVLIGIDKRGRWYRTDDARVLERADRPKAIRFARDPNALALVPANRAKQWLRLANKKSERPVDVVFPILHGTFGEDGTVQGLLKMADIPFVGAGVLGSAVGMDKDAMKRLLRDARIPSARFITAQSTKEVDFAAAARELGLPLFIKPANCGSSVGIHKVKNESQFAAAVKDAFRYDRKILLEEFIQGREIECSVLGNDDPIASLPGEIITRHEFYSYEAKYLDEKGAALEIPAKLPEDVVENIQRIAVRTFKALYCEGMARVDFFLRGEREVLVNEINTIPGFTKISMYPKLWEATGIGYTELIDRLIQLAIERYEREKKLKTSFDL
ncbi:MAG TPA: D-alanine--D-alanine ligase [Candidatus Binatia bacterium]|nr:D-alanine--D-alanine ligase [Candidatus Binatia bacterium]